MKVWLLLALVLLGLSIPIDGYMKFAAGVGILLCLLEALDCYLIKGLLKQTIFPVELLVMLLLIVRLLWEI